MAYCKARPIWSFIVPVSYDFCSIWSINPTTWLTQRFSLCQDFPHLAIVRLWRCEPSSDQLVFTKMASKSSSISDGVCILQRILTTTYSSLHRITYGGFIAFFLNKDHYDGKVQLFSEETKKNYPSIHGWRKGQLEESGNLAYWKDTTTFYLEDAPSTRGSLQ